MAQKFKLTNITRKKNPTNKREAVGHAVSVNVLHGGIKSNKTLQPGKHALTEVLEEHHLKYAKGGLIDIQPIKDVSVLLREHAQPSVDESDSKKTKKTKKKTSKASKDTKTEELVGDVKKPKRMAKAISMHEGSAQAKRDLESDNEGAVNPDGKDNFTAVAPNDGKGKVDESRFTVTAPSKPNRNED